MTSIVSLKNTAKTESKIWMKIEIFCDQENSGKNRMSVFFENHENHRKLKNSQNNAVCSQWLQEPCPVPEENTQLQGLSE
jgi:hypothetical protein